MGFFSKIGGFFKKAYNKVKKVAKIGLNIATGGVTGIIGSAIKGVGGLLTSRGQQHEDHGSEQLQQAGLQFSQNFPSQSRQLQSGFLSGQLGKFLPFIIGGVVIFLLVKKS